MTKKFTTYPKVKIHGTEHRIMVSYGNTKVQFPYIDMMSAMQCPSRKWCAFDATGEYKGKSPRHLKCYAQKSEKFHTNLAVSKEKNRTAIEHWNSMDTDAQHEFIERLASTMANMATKRETRYIRLNTAGDVYAGNVDFAVQLITALSMMGLTPFLYTKAVPSVQRKLRESGAVVLRSDVDFIPYVSESELPEGAAVCGGICAEGICTRCPDGLTTYIKEH